MFAMSLDLVEACGLTHLHVFPFSPRPGTPAARMPLVAREIVKSRAERLRQAGAARVAAHLDAQAGKTLRVLIERGGHGRAEDFTLVRMGGRTAGEIVEVKIVGHDGTALLCESPEPPIFP
jgi:threonylcarbamoyladenosine tRNA methylthiotransferase MtaB